MSWLHEPLLFFGLRPLPPRPSVSSSSTILQVAHSVGLKVNCSTLKSTPSKAGKGRQASQSFSGKVFQNAWRWLILMICGMELTDNITENKAMKDHHLIIKKSLTTFTRKHLGIWNRIKILFSYVPGIVTKWKRYV